MVADLKRKGSRTDVIVAAILIVGGLAISGLALMQLGSRDVHRMAQATQPSETPSVPAGKTDGPAESTPGGARPTTPAPEPARPDADAQKKGATPALPSAPAEKMGEPIKR